MKSSRWIWCGCATGCVVFGTQFIGDLNAPNGKRSLHASGHASGPDLLRLVRCIQPQIVIPIHTEQPEYFVTYLEREEIKVHLPKTDELIVPWRRLIW